MDQTVVAIWIERKTHRLYYYAPMIVHVLIDGRTNSRS